MRHRLLAGAPETLFTQTRSSQSGRPDTSPGGAPHSRRAAGRTQQRRGRMHERHLDTGMRAGHATRPVPRKARTPDNARREGFFGRDERQRVRGALVEGEQHRRAVQEREDAWVHVMGSGQATRSGVQPNVRKNVRNHDCVTGETSFKAIRPRTVAAN